VVDLRLGDCLEILPTLADKSVDAIITDLPYGTTACSWDVVIPFAPMWEQVKRLCKGAFVTTASQPFTSLLITSNLDWFKYEWVWQKSGANNFIACNREPMKVHENVVVFGEKYPPYNPQMTAGKPYTITAHSIPLVKGKTSGADPKPMQTVNTGTRYPRTVVNYPLDKKDHPTQKPVALYEYLIQTYTNAGDTVLDFTMGSGTTGVACVKLGRNFIGIEKEPKYYEIAERRIKEAQQQMVMEL
jgi:DNA modification methylase